MKVLYRSSLLVLLSFAIFFTLLGAASRDPTAQLISFKNSLPNPTLLPNWLPNQNPCTFTRITCNQTHLTSIDLTSIPLSTDLTVVTTYLLTLDHLQFISLKSTNLTGSLSLPPSHSNCASSLSAIDLSQNALSGSLSDMSFFSSCSNLQSLNLSSNLLEFNSPRWKLNLRVADFSYNKISGPTLIPWLLNHLALKGNKISSESDFSAAASLQYLDLSANKYFGDIAHTLFACNRLVYLNVSSNQFSGPLPSLPSGPLPSLPSV
uniref:Brassinosteroid LRR receptor kinase n=1 Tax=Cajanus cajan TaxID=3821 RepID=A0A151UFR3_CAJCA